MSNSPPNDSLNLKTINKNVYATIPGYGDRKSTSVKEKNLFSFLESISTEYHGGTTSLGLKHVGNNGGIGIPAKQMEHKLAMRALTLIKGGFGSSIVKSTNELLDDGNAFGTNTKHKKKRALIQLEGSISRKKRKRRNNLIKVFNNKNTLKTKAGQEHHHGEILFGLNHMWNQYILNLLQNEPSAMNKKSISNILSTAELIGASVEISRSDSTSHTGKRGFIVDSTMNTWLIATPSDSSNKDLKVKITCDNWKILTLPKNGSDLIIDIPRKASSEDRIHLKISSLKK
jgi:RNase P/RNase MRP subunit p29